MFAIRWTQNVLRKKDSLSVTTNDGSITTVSASLTAYANANFSVTTNETWSFTTAGLTVRFLSVPVRWFG